MADIKIVKPTVMVFAADHGVATHGVSIAPQAVTRQMVLFDKLLRMCLV